MIYQIKLLNPRLVMCIRSKNIKPNGKGLEKNDNKKRVNKYTLGSSSS